VPELPRTQLIGYLAAGAIVVVLGALWVRGGAHGAGAGGSAEPVKVGGAGARGGGGGGARAGGRGGGTVVVHVAGAVRHPGVYRVRAGIRVNGAVRRAGGATPRADLNGLNLAARVEDGRQVVVPERVVVAGGVAGAAGVTATSPPAAPVNLNTATVEELDTVEGIGPTTAEKIVAQRQQQGGFGSVDELDQVPGIGPKTLEALRERVTV
jgi:competence protein ComEA